MSGVLGFDSADPVPAVPRALERLGPPAFWARLFSPGGGSEPMDASRAHAVDECRAIWDSGARHLVPCMAAAGRLAGTRAMGISDAMTFCHAIRNVYNWVGPLEVPAPGVIYAYLAQDPGEALSLGYWQGWAGFVHSFPLGGRHPLYPALRGDPEAAIGNCRTVTRPGAPDCWAVWSTGPHLDAGDDPRAARWAPSRCATAFPTTMVWQVGAAGSVGVDRTAPDQPGTAAMLVLLDRP